MKITRLSVFKVPLTSHIAYYMADGKACDTVDSIVIRLDTDQQISGWGEVCPIPHYLPAYAGGVLPAVQELAPVILGADPRGPEALMDRCNAHLQGHEYAKSAIDIALWDLAARAAAMPLYQLLGGLRTPQIPLYHSISCLAPERMAEIALQAYQEGIRQFQVKLGADDNWQTDVARLIAVRQAVGKGPLVYGDWNCGSTTLNAIRVAQAVCDHDIMLEQPCDSIEACATVRRVSGSAMKLDESVHDMSSLLHAHSLGCADVVAVKLSKFGGLTPSKQARDLCAHLKIMMVIEDVWGSDITTAALTHLAASTRSRYLLNACDLSAYVAPHIAPDGPRRQQAQLTVSNAQGLGVTPDTQVLGEPLAVIDERL